MCELELATHPGRPAIYIDRLSEIMGAVAYFFGAALLALVGYLIRFRRWAWLIAGYNTSSRASKERYDVAELTRGVGNLAFLLAALLMVAGVGVLVGLTWVTVAAMGLLVAASLVFLIHANTGGRYLKGP